MEAQVFEALGVVVPVVALGWTIWAWLADRRGEILVNFMDEYNLPRTDITVVGPGGVSFCPDGRGIVALPRDWAKTAVSIRDRETWRELAIVVILRKGKLPQKITLSGNRETLRDLVTAQSTESRESPQKISPSR
ncbi:MAG: hypothetical protein WAM82_29225 [Thermoanaerobaculia bacterium]